MIFATTTYATTAATKLASVMRCRNIAAIRNAHGNGFALAGRCMR